MMDDQPEVYFTAGESQAALEGLFKGRLKNPPVSTLEAKLSLRHRQKEELELGELRNKPDLRKALLELCEKDLGPDEFAARLLEVCSKNYHSMMDHEFFQKIIVHPEYGKPLKPYKNPFAGGP